MKQFANLSFALFICAFLCTMAPIVWFCRIVRNIFAYRGRYIWCHVRFETMCIAHSIRDTFNETKECGLFVIK